MEKIRWWGIDEFWKGLEDKFKWEEWKENKTGWNKVGNKPWFQWSFRANIISVKRVDWRGAGDVGLNYSWSW